MQRRYFGINSNEVRKSIHPYHVSPSPPSAGNLSSASGWKSVDGSGLHCSGGPVRPNRDIEPILIPRCLGPVESMMATHAQSGGGMRMCMVDEGRG